MINRWTVTVALLCTGAPVEGFAPLSSSRSSIQKRESRTSVTRPMFKWSSSSEKETETSTVVETKGMPDLISFLQPGGVKEPSSASSNKNSNVLVTKGRNDEGLSEFDGDMSNSMSFGTVFSIAALVGGLIVLTAGNYLGVGLDDVAHTASSFVQHPQQTLSDLIEDIQNIGPAAPFFYGLLYCVAEILAVPATPLTLSAGYLFGLPQGVAVVLTAGTIAACVGFAIGKTALRGAVEGLLDENPEFRKLDRAVGTEGFRLLVLVRLTPLFPFSLSNYIYGASAIRFWPYFWGTLLGFTPGTIAYVYSGMVGQALLSGEGSQPWYYYAAGAAALGGALKFITDTATGIVKTMEEDMDD